MNALPLRLEKQLAAVVTNTVAPVIMTEINTGSYKSSTAGWVSGLSIANAQSSALTWASESNAQVCTVVMPGGVSALQSVDLSGAYTTSATPTVKLQVAKQGYR